MHCRGRGPKKGLFNAGNAGHFITGRELYRSIALSLSEFEITNLLLKPLITDHSLITPCSVQGTEDYTEYGSRTLLRNLCEFVPDYTASGHYFSSHKYRPLNSVGQLEQEEEQNKKKKKEKKEVKLWEWELEKEGKRNSRENITEFPPSRRLSLISILILSSQLL